MNSTTLTLSCQCHNTIPTSVYIKAKQINEAFIMRDGMFKLDFYLQLMSV